MGRTRPVQLWTLHYRFIKVRIPRLISHHRLTLLLNPLIRRASIELAPNCDWHNPVRPHALLNCTEDFQWRCYGASNAFIVL